MAPQTLPKQVQTINGLAAVKIRDAARLLNCSPQHVYNEIARGHVKTFTLGRSRRIAVAELLRLMREDGGGPDAPAA